MRQALLKLHASIFLWGFTGVLGRLISLNEGLLVWYRIFVTVISLYVLMRAKNQLYRVPPAQRSKLFGIGGLIALHWCFFYGSIKYSNVSIGLTCLSSAGLFTAVLEPLLTGKRINPVETLLGMFAIIGIYLIFHFDPQYKTGIILGLSCTVFSVLFSIFNKKQVAYTSPRVVMLYELFGGLVLLTLAMPVYLHFIPASHLLPTRLDWLWLLLLSWLCTIVAFDMSLQSLQKVSAFTQNLISNLEPVYGILLAFAIYHENKFLSSGFYLGFGLIVSAVVLQMVRVTRKRQPVPAVG